MTASTIPAAKQAIFNALDSADLGDLTPAVSYGTPASWQPNALVWVGAARRTVDTSAMVGGGGTGWLRESYVLELHVRVSLQTQSGRDVDVAAYDIVAAIEAALRVDPSLGGVVAVARPIDSEETVDVEQQKARRVCHVVIAVHCTATI